MTFRIKNLSLTLILLSTVALTALNCSSPVAGGGTRGGNPVVYGKIIGADGNGAQKVLVRLFPENYNPVTDGTLPQSNADTTDEEGNYQLQLPDTGGYSLYALDAEGKTSLLRKNISIEKDTECLPESKLQIPAQIAVNIAHLENTQNGFLYIAGTDIVIPLSQAVSQISFTVPSGSITILFTNNTVSQLSQIMVEDLFVEPGESLSAPSGGWTHSKKVFLNTTVSGANLKESLSNFPLLIKLTSANFDFTTARPQGEDIRFISSEGAWLPYEIENWDPINRQATVWVKISEIKPQDSTQFFKMNWGNPACSDSSNGSAVFETSDGFQGVYHLSEQADQKTRDATANGYHGTSANMTTAEGVAGHGRLFNGTSSYILLDGTAKSKLDFPFEGQFTISIWVAADSVESNRQIIGKGNYQYHLKLQEYNWAFNDYSDIPAAGWHYTSYPFTKQTWTHLTGIRKNTSMYLYVNGECVDSIAKYNSDTLPRATSFDVEIGRRSEIDGRKAWFFQGLMDEIQISDVARKPEWIRLSYLNQKGEGSFVRFGK